jgi:hypothetical protein
VALSPTEVVGHAVMMAAIVHSARVFAIGMTGTKALSTSMPMSGTSGGSAANWMFAADVFMVPRRLMADPPGVGPWR